MSRPRNPPERSLDTDIVVIGAGPAGASVAIRLAARGWRVTLVEQARFPRQKVCGECLGPASLELLDEIGLGSTVATLAGAPIRRVAWMVGERTIVADMPAHAQGRYAYGCALGRDSLDLTLLEQARARGVQVLQPARVRRILGAPGHFACRLEWRAMSRPDAVARDSLSAAIVIDAHGSWERGPELQGAAQPTRVPRPTDLFAFKNTFEAAALDPGVLPVLCLPGGYGGMVVADGGRTTVACCIRRDHLRRLRADHAGVTAATAVDAYLRAACGGVARALRAARALEPWHAVGPLRTGFRHRGVAPLLQIGNAALEAHPLIGEGICMALQSSAVLAQLLATPPQTVDADFIRAVQQAHTRICRRAFARRLQFAQLCTQIAMRPVLARAAAALLQGRPALLTTAARFAGKARGGAVFVHGIGVSA